MTTQTHIFAVGVEKYQKPKIKPVAFAENDAREFVNAWQNLGVDPSNCLILLSANATKASIESSFKRFINGVAKGDTIIFFFAGHGFAYNDESYLTTHDTQPGDIKSTSISLAHILKQIRASPSQRVIMFIDACESGFPVAAGMRSITSSFTGEELRIFCKDAEHHVGFAACKADESSWSNSTFKHGIWSYAVIRALSGDEKKALKKGCLITSDSLRDYLADEIPRLLRITRTGNETQTPCFFGNATKQFIVADLGKILAARAAKANALGNVLKDSCLRGEESGRVRNLSGFKKGHRVPDGHFSAAEAFVRRVGDEEVREQSDTIYELLRSTFSYKRRDIDYVCDDGAGTIKTPDFDVNVSIKQDSENPGDYVLTTEVRSIRRPEVLTEDGFSDVFSKYCDTVVIELSRSMDLEAKIDEIEDIPELAKNLKYEPDCSSFTLRLEASRIQIHATSDEIEFSVIGSHDVKALLSNAQNALAALNGSGVLLLPQA